ncbi:MAG: hypothetical protein IKK34_05670 [Clostridia bacterium]|nr:hypothetical protein [Clostridia bacterium]
MMVLLMIAVCGIASADADPIRVSSLSEPQSVISEQDVAITIKVYNSSQKDMESPITIFNPVGISVEKYSGLKGEQSVTYTGTWRVTKEQIEEGKIKYFIKYAVDTGNGPTETTRTIPVTIQTEAAAPQLTATYSVTPVSAREGQEVTLSYTLANTGNVELRNIVIKNEGVSKEELAQPALSVGEKVTLTDKFTMGKKELVSKPTVTYQAADSKKALTISDMARKTITIAEDGLEAELKAEKTENLYPGETIKLAIELKNTGSTSYSGLTATLSDGTELASGVELAPGASFKQGIEWSASEDTVVSANVTGTDANGDSVAVASNEITVTTQDASGALVLNIMADVENEVIHSEPAVLRFGVVVENIGELDATNLSITQADTLVAKIPSLPAGESRTVVFDAETSIAGKFQFVVTGRDGAGSEKSYASNILQVTYAAPTPAPTAKPTPTPVPPTPSPAPTATPEPTLGQMIADKVDPVVLYAVAGGLAAAIIVILTISGVSSAKRKKRMAQAIDVIERKPDTRNHTGARRRRPQTEKPKKEVSDDSAIVPTTELTEEEASRMKEEAANKPASATPARDAMRHRRAQMDIPTDETLRVAPVDQRPEFIAQGRVDDSATRIFGRLTEDIEVPVKQDTTRVAPVKDAEQEAPVAVAETPADDPLKDEPAGATIRINKAQIDEIRQQREDKFAGKGRKRNEVKPLRKQKKGLFGGLKKADEEDDFLEDADYDDGDDDLFE